MGMDIKKIDGIVAKFQDETGLNLEYSIVSVHDAATQQYGKVLELRIGPLPIALSGGLEHTLAKKIADKNKVLFRDYDFALGTDEGPCYRPIFSVICPEDELETAVQKLKAARLELDSLYESLAAKMVTSQAES